MGFAQFSQNTPRGDGSAVFPAGRGGGDGATGRGGGEAMGCGGGEATDREGGGATGRGACVACADDPVGVDGKTGTGRIPDLNESYSSERFSR